MKAKSYLLWGAFALGMALTLSDGAAAFARAGGGEGYGGGFGGGGGGDFGGGGGLFSLWPLLFLGHGSGSFIFIIIIIYYILRQVQARGGAPHIFTNYGGSASSGFVPPSVPAGLTPAQPASAQSVSQGLDAIKQRDPNFNEASFLDRSQTAFFKIQQAWTQRNQDVARDVMSDALYERHKMQTDQQIANHQQDVLQNIVIGHARISDVKPGAPYDAIAVAISASMIDYTIDDRTKQLVSGQRSPTTFTEYWTFIRRADAKSNAGSTALASTCPSCGAPLKLTNGRCDFCGAPVRSSSNEWVVDQIEQAV